MTPIPENIPVVIRYPAGMTGKKLRKKLNILEPEKSKEDFRVCCGLRCVPKSKRLQFLRDQADGGSEVDYATLRNMRGGFNKNKFQHLPLSGNGKCYCCCVNKAVLRHHVLPLFRGGRNSRNNIVPLCNGCHCKVHPHMGAKEDDL